MRLLVTRPAADAAPLARELEARGHEVLTDSLLEIRPTGAPLTLDGVTALLFTSGNGVRSFAAATPRRQFAVYTAGDRTAEIAREAGFTQVTSAAGDGEALARLVIAGRKPGDGALLHASGTFRSGDLAGTLGGAGFDVRVVPLYEAVPATALNPATRSALEQGKVDGVLLFSPRTARHMVMLLHDAGLAARMAGLEAWCLSNAVAATIAELPFTEIHVAAEPTQEALLADIDAAPQPKETSVTEEGPSPIVPERLVLPPKPKKHRLRLLILVVALVIVAAAAVWLWGGPLLHPAQRADSGPPPVETAAAGPETAAPTPETADTQEVAKPAVDPQYAALAARVDRLGGEVTALRQQIAETPAPAAAPADGAPDLSAPVAALGNRIAALEAKLQRQQREDQSARALALAAGQIGEAVATGAPYAAPLAVLQSAAAGDADLTEPIDVLAKHADSGVPTRWVLAKRLEQLPAALAAPAPAAPDTPFWDRVENRIASLVTVRRADAGNPASLPPGREKFVATAEAELESGDLPAAIASVRKLSGHDAELARPWLDQATARLDTEQAAAAVEAAATQRLHDAQGTAP